jgi:hypothetical protein
VEYKIHDHKYEWKGNFNKAKNLIETALQELGHTEGDNGLDIYNHTCLDNLNDLHWPVLFVKPTAPTGEHFAIDDLGYANSSRLTFEEPIEYEHMYSHLNPTNHMNWSNIVDLIERKANKWDDSILLKWKPAKKVPEDHILIIGQLVGDETVDGFGFGHHFTRLSQVVGKLEDENIVVKLHPKFRGFKKTIQGWRDKGIDVRTGFNSIHDFLPRTRVAIIDNSTSGIECLMHQVPIISYGWPEYHWVTKKLKSLTELRGLVSNTSWHHKDRAKKFIYWYIHDYLCYDLHSTKRRLKECLPCL